MDRRASPRQCETQRLLSCFTAMIHRDVVPHKIAQPVTTYQWGEGPQKSASKTSRPRSRDSTAILSSQLLGGSDRAGATTTPSTNFCHERQPTTMLLFLPRKKCCGYQIMNTSLRNWMIELLERFFQALDRAMIALGFEYIP